MLASDTFNSLVKEALENKQQDVFCFESAQHCVNAIQNRPCDILVVAADDYTHEHLGLFKQCQKAHPFLPILAVVEKSDIPAAIKAAKAGAHEILEKPLNEHKIAKAVESVLNTHAARHKDSSAGNPLTTAEKKVLKFVLKGLSSKEIAKALNRSERTIEVHRLHIMKKAGVDNLVDLVKCAVQMGLVEIED